MDTVIEKLIHSKVCMEDIVLHNIPMCIIRILGFLITLEFCVFVMAAQYLNIKVFIIVSRLVSVGMR